MDSFFKKLNPKAKEYLVDHICFPYKLPQRGSKNRSNHEVFSMHDHESKFLSLITQVLYPFKHNPLSIAPSSPLSSVPLKNGVAFKILLFSINNLSEKVSIA